MCSLLKLRWLCSHAPRCSADGTFRGQGPCQALDSQEVKERRFQNICTKNYSFYKLLLMTFCSMFSFRKDYKCSVLFQFSTAYFYSFESGEPENSHVLCFPAQVATASWTEPTGARRRGARATPSWARDPHAGVPTCWLRVCISV